MLPFKGASCTKGPAGATLTLCIDGQGVGRGREGRGGEEGRKNEGGDMVEEMEGRKYKSYLKICSTCRQLSNLDCSHMIPYLPGS